MNESADAAAGFERNRARLFGLAYRMLGSRAEAEDVVQEAYVRWHQSDRDVIRNAEAWLVTTATRLAIDRLRALRTEREAYVGPWLREPLMRLRFRLLNAWREAPFYSDRERAALEWTEAITRVADTHVPDEVFTRVRVHFDESQLVALTFAAVVINSFNRLAISFRVPAGTYQPQPVHA